MFAADASNSAISQVTGLVEVEGFDSHSFELGREGRAVWLAFGVPRGAAERRYVGTATTGNVYRYRYYTCWSHNRYGTRTCDADRLPAQELDEAILRSLLQTFERRATFDRACRAAAKQADGRRADLRRELKAIEAEIAKAEASIERYFYAFNGTMPEARCAERVNALGDRLVELRARRTTWPHSSPRPRRRHLPTRRWRCCAATSTG